MAVAPNTPEPASTTLPSPTATPTPAPAVSPPEGDDDSRVLESLVDEDTDTDDESVFSGFDDSSLAGPVDGDELPAVEPAPAAPPPPVPSPEVAPAVAPAAPAPAAPTRSNAEVWTAWRNDAEKTLAEGHFKMSDDLVAEAEADPAKFAREVLPRLASKVYLDAVAAASSAINHHLPAVVEQLLSSRTETAKAEDAFFTAWPQLDRAKHTAKVTEIGRSWRGMNPSAPAEEYIRQVGAMSVMALGLPLQAVAAAPTAAPLAAPLRPHIPLVTSAPRVAPSANGQQPNPFDFGGSRASGFQIEDDE